MTSPGPADGGHLGDLLSALVDGELTEPERTAAERHLEGCEECQAEYEVTTGVHELVADLPALAVPAPLWATISTTRRRRPRPVVWLSACAAVAGISILAASPPRHPVTPQMARLVEVHAVASGNDPVTQLAPAAVPTSFGRP